VFAITGFIDEVIESFKQTLNLRLWAYFLLLQLAEGFFGFIISMLFVLIGLIVALGSIGSMGFENIGQLLSEPSTWVNLLGWIIFLVGMLMLTLTYISAVFSGLRFNLFNDFLKTKKLSLATAFKKTTPRILTFFKVQLIVAIVIFIVLGIAMLPLIGFIQAMVASGSSSAVAGPIIGTILYFVVLMLVLGIAMFLVSPVLSLLAPTAFFGEHNAMGSIKRSFALVKANYLGNLAFVLVYTVIVMALSYIISAFLSIVQLFTILPATIGMQSGNASAAAGFFGGFFVYTILSIVLLVPFGIWAACFETACFRNLYFHDLGLLGAKKTGQKHKGK